MRIIPTYLNTFLFSLAFLLLPELAYGHIDNEGGGSFFSGIIHPLTGIDHLIAMFAVGLWGAQLGQPALWMLPVAFPLIMALGGIGGMLAFPLTGIEVGIASSAILLGLCVFLSLRPPLFIAITLVAVFAIFHGYAHGQELPDMADPLYYATGFVIATGLIHLSGIFLGTVSHHSQGAKVVKLCGLAITALGSYFLTSALMITPT